MFFLWTKCQCTTGAGCAHYCHILNPTARMRCLQLMFLQTRDALTLTKHVQRGAYIGIYTTRPRVKHICSSIFLWWKVIHVVITRRHLEWWFHFWQNQDHCVAGKLNECFPRWHTLMCIRFTTARYKGISANFRLWLRRKAMRRSRLSFIRHCYTLHNSSWSDLGFQHMVCTDIYSAVWKNP